MNELHGSQVVLRALAESDAAPLRAIRIQPEVADWWGRLEDDFPLEEPTAERLTIVVDGSVVGMVQVTEENEDDYRSAEVDIFLDAEHRGRGIGPDALQTLIGHLTAERGHHRVFLSANVHNARAIRAYEKAGFRTVGTMRLAGRDFRTGRYEDELLMEYVVQPRE